MLVLFYPEDYTMYNNGIELRYELYTIRHLNGLYMNTNIRKKLHKCFNRKAINSYTLSLGHLTLICYYKNRKNVLQNEWYFKSVF